MYPVIVVHLSEALLIKDTDDYNSWIESDKALKLAAKLPKDTVLAEGYDEYNTGRTYLVSLGDWRNNKDEEVALDGIGGVNILVKADVHRAGTFGRV
jgi:Anp1